MCQVDAGTGGMPLREHHPYDTRWQEQGGKTKVARTRWQGGKRKKARPRWQDQGGKDKEERKKGRKNKKFIGNIIETESARIDSIQICETQHFNN